jgi:hypothetical protein
VAAASAGLDLARAFKATCSDARVPHGHRSRWAPSGALGRLRASLSSCQLPWCLPRQSIRRFDRPPRSGPAAMLV